MPASHQAARSHGLESVSSVEECAAREVMEETGLDVEVVGRGPYTSNIFPEEDNTQPLVPTAQQPVCLGVRARRFCRGIHTTVIVRRGA